MPEVVYDSRAWTGEVPDYRAIIRKWLGLQCPEASWIIAAHFHSPVSPEMRAEIERLLERSSHAQC